MSDPALDFSVTAVVTPGDPAAQALLIEVRGDLDYSHHAELEAVLDHRLPQVPDAGRVVVDLADVPYCDSCGLRVLLTASQAVTARGGELVLRGVSGQPARALRLTGLDAVLPGAAVDTATDTPA